MSHPNTKTLSLALATLALTLFLFGCNKDPKPSTTSESTPAAAGTPAPSTEPPIPEHVGPVDTSMLKAPKGAKAAIIVFEDLQCPMCSRAAPQLETASATYKIPVIRHDFPLPKHDWSYQAAIIARYFDQTSKELGNQFRDYLFSNQIQINPGNLRSYADTFAAAHKIGLPFVVDPQGKLADLVTEDRILGQKIGLDHTPTIYVVSARPGATPVEVQSNLSNLYELIDANLKQ